MLLLVALEVSTKVLGTVAPDVGELELCELDPSIVEVVWPADKTELPGRDEDDSRLDPKSVFVLLPNDVPEVRAAASIDDDSAELLVVEETSRLLDVPDLVDAWGLVNDPVCEMLETEFAFGITEAMLDTAEIVMIEDAVDDAVSLDCKDAVMVAEVEAELDVGGKVDEATEVLDIVGRLVVEFAREMADVDPLDTAVDRLGSDDVVRLARRLDADADDELGAAVDRPTLSALIMSAAL